MCMWGGKIYMLLREIACWHLYTRCNECVHVNVLMQIVFKTRIYHCNINSQVRASLVPGPEEEEEEKGPRFSCSQIRLIAMEFHCLRILLIYFCDASIHTKRYTVCRFIIAAVLIQRLIWSYKRTVWAPLQSVDEKKRLLTYKTIARGNLGFHCTSVCPFC